MLTARETKSESTAEASVRPKTKAKVREQYRPIDQETGSLLHGICSRLGHLPPDGNLYILSVDFSDALDDLVRVISSDEGSVLVKLGEMQVVGRHLTPMLRVVSRNRFGDALFTLFNLLLLLTSAETTANRATPELLLDCRRQYKKVFESKEIFTALLQVALTCVQPQRDTAVNDSELLRKVFLLIRNLLAIPDATISYTSSHVALASSFGKQERIISALKESRLLEFIIVAASSCKDSRDGRVFGPHVPILVEIFQCLFCSSDPDAIAAIHGMDLDGPQVCETEQSLQKEHKMRRPIRHGRFSGSVVVKLSNHFGDNSVAARTFEKRMVFEIAVDFLKSCFNELISFCHESNAREQVDDSLNWNISSLMAWCLRLVRQLQSHPQPPVEILCIYAAIDVDSMVTFGRLLFRFLHTKQHTMVMACSLYFREAFRLLDFMVHSPVETIATAGKDIEAALFYRHEVIAVFRTAIQESRRFSTKMLCILVEANHVLLKLLKSYCSGKRHVFIAQAKRSANRDSEDEASQQDAEKEFIFDNFIGGYANETLVDAYTRLLREARNLDPNTNRFVATMLGRLVKETKMPMLLYRASVLDALHFILTFQNPGWRKMNTDLIKIASAVSKSFLEEARKDPVMLIGAFFNSLCIFRPERASNIGEDFNDLEIATLPGYWTEEEKTRWLIRTLVDAEMTLAITWLCGRLFDAAASRGVEMEDASVPDFYLHAQTDSIKDAMNNPHFRSLLVEAKVERPTVEERSWRILGTASADQIIQKANLIQSTLREAISAENQGSIMTSRPSTIMRSKIDTAESEDSGRDSESGDESRDSEGGNENRDSESEDHGEPQAAPYTPATSKWENLKRNNFFLSGRLNYKSDSENEDENGSGDEYEKGNGNKSEKYNGDKDEKDGEDKYERKGDYYKEEQEFKPTRAKRPPLAIYSEEE